MNLGGARRHLQVKFLVGPARQSGLALTASMGAPGQLEGDVGGESLLVVGPAW